MIKLYTDYFTLEQDSPSTELYYWEDVLRVAYYIHSDSSYYRSSTERATLYLIIQHECGDYLRIPKGSSEWNILDQSLHLYLPIIKHDRRELLRKAPPEELIDIFIK